MKREVWIIAECSVGKNLLQVEKNIYNDELPANVIDSVLLLFWSTQAISSARRLHVSLLFFRVSWILFLTNKDKIIL